LDSILFSLFLILISILAIYREETGQNFDFGNIYYDLSVYTIILVAALIAISFSIYGIRFIRSIAQLTTAGDDNDLNSRLLVKIVLISLVYTGCFILRCFAFSYRYITGLTLNEILFYILGYFLTEGLSTFCACILIMLRQMKIKNEDNIFRGTRQKESGLMISQMSVKSSNQSF